MNAVWLMMMMVAIAVMTVRDPAAVLPAMIESAGGAITTCFSLLGVYLVWLGLFALLEGTGINRALAALLRPVIRWLYGDLPPLTAQYVSLNMSANMLGLGGAATPMGIRAMQALDDGSGTACDAAIMLIVVNATSIQLLPTTLIGIRAAAGSAAPADIILPGLVATVVTTILGVALCKLCAGLGRRRARRRRRGLAAPAPQSAKSVGGTR